MSRFRRQFLVAAVAAGVIGAACGDDGGTSGSTAASSTTSTSTSTAAPAPSSDPPPSVPASEPTVSLRPVAQLAGAAGVADPDGPGPVLVATLTGEILSLDLESGSTEPVLDLGGVISTGGEQGLLDIAITPDGDRLVANLTNPSGATEIRSWPMRAGRPEGEATQGTLHLEIAQPYANHNGGNLEFGPDGHLWIGTGDGGSGGDPDDRAQDPDDLLGKMLRVSLDPAGGLDVPDDNPSEGAPEVWAVGLRNPWRYSFDAETGALWVADVGQNEIEEVTVVDPADVTGGDAAANFGWNRLEGDQPFSGTAPADAIAPAFTYRHDETGGCSITGGHVYRGSAVESLVGWYVFGDYCGGWLRAVPADEPGSDPVGLVDGLDPVVSIEVLEDGELLVLTADHVFAVTAS